MLLDEDSEVDHEELKRRYETDEILDCVKYGRDMVF